MATKGTLMLQRLF